RRVLSRDDIVPLEEVEQHETREEPQPFTVEEPQPPAPEERLQPDTPGHAATSLSLQTSRAPAPSVHAKVVVDLPG
ncbi:unnamed protein product, partial [Citrullus colocynthis]